MRGTLVVAIAIVSISVIPLAAQNDVATPHARQKSAAKPSAGKASVAPKPEMQKAELLVPLTERERAEQILDRFTFGPRPGDVDRVLAMGADKWLERQLTPDAIKDPALDRRLADFPTLNMSPEQALTVFPDRGTIQRVADGKQPMPTDPLLAAMYEVQVAKLRQQTVNTKPDASGNLPTEPSDAEKSAEKQGGQFAAARIAGELLAMPKNQRMTALIQMPVEDRIAFTSYAQRAISGTCCWRTLLRVSARFSRGWRRVWAHSTRLARSWRRPRWCARS